jgi:hypothetical protein
MTRDDKFGWLQSAYVLIVSWLGVWSFHAHTTEARIIRWSTCVICLIGGSILFRVLRRSNLLQPKPQGLKP